MHVVIALTYGLTIWMASVIYALIAAPHWAGMAIALAPVVISGSMASILTLDVIVSGLSRLIIKKLRKPKEKSRAA